jgi:hypothetical protein
MSPRYGLLDALPMFSSSGSFSAADFQAIASIKDSADLPPSAVLDVFGIAYLIGPTSLLQARHDLDIIHTRMMFGESVSVAFNQDFFPPSWVVYTYAVFDKSGGSVALAQSTIAKIPPEPGQSANLESGDVIPAWAMESEHEVDFPNESATAGGVNHEPVDRRLLLQTCTTRRTCSTEVSVRVRLNDPGLVVSNDYYFSGWRCVARDLATGHRFAVPIVRVNGVMRGVFLPAGEFELTYRYRPFWFAVGLSCSTIAWVVWIGVIARAAARPRLA